MTSDGWRPILGTRHEPPYQDEIKYYRNPSHLSETVKAETTSLKPTAATTIATSPKPTSSVPASKIHIYNSGTNGQIVRGERKVNLLKRTQTDIIKLNERGKRL